MDQHTMDRHGMIRRDPEIDPEEIPADELTTRQIVALDSAAEAVRMKGRRLKFLPKTSAKNKAQKKRRLQGSKKARNRRG